MKKKAITFIVATAFVLAVAVSGTLAWLQTKTDSVVNTFTYGDINITLTETDTGLDSDGNVNTNTYKMIPGNSIKKDPKVTVLNGSEDCWLFVKAEKSDNFDNFMTYTMKNDWRPLDGVSDVYYRKVEQVNGGTSFDVIEGNEVKVKEEVTKNQLNNLTEGNFPTLTFTAYAVQIENISSAADAWNIISGN